MPPQPILTPIGYKWLAEHFAVDPIPHFVESYLSEPGVRMREEGKGRRREIYPAKQFDPRTVFDHLEFALKREGLHLPLLRLILPRLAEGEVAMYVRATPTGKNARRIWYLYEQFTASRLPLADLRTGNYVDLLDAGLYVTGIYEKCARWRINDNLLHTVEFSPMLRRTDKVNAATDAALNARCEDFMGEVPPEVFQRALRYLYARETRTSYAIEQEKPTAQRMERFMALLGKAGSEDYLTVKGLVHLQNAIVDPRYAAQGWREMQNYVGETLAPGREEIHLVPPRPEDLEVLMRGWLKVADYLGASRSVPPIAAAAVVSWLFVYFHPFEDGNGRIHRFLIHHILARRQFGPEGVLLPVSAVLLNRPAEYEASLEVFSRPLKERTRWEFDADGHLVVENDTLDHFRYIDCTEMAEALYGFIEETIEKELPAEIHYLQYYDAARAAMRDIVDMPEPAANLLLRLCLQNQGRLSKAKRKHAYFLKLTDAEVSALEQAIRSAYHLPEGGGPGDGEVI